MQYTKTEFDRPVEGLHQAGWILPDGRFFGCGFGMHTELACRILAHFFEETFERVCKNWDWFGLAERELGLVGAIKCSCGPLTGRYYVAFEEPDIELSVKQGKTLADWSLKYGVKLGDLEGLQGKDLGRYV